MLSGLFVPGLLRTFSFALILVALPLGSAFAEISISYSPEVVAAVKNAGRDPANEQTGLQKDLNTGLAELAKTNASAKAVYDSGQKVRIICFDSKEAKGLGFSAGMLGLGESKGAFGADGKPVSGATATIAIDCDQFGRAGLTKPFQFIDEKTTGFRILVHELLHLSNAKRTHGSGPDEDKLDLYEKFVDDFMAALKKAKRDEARAARAERRKQRQATGQAATGSFSGDGASGATVRSYASVQDEDTCVATTYYWETVETVGESPGGGGNEPVAVSAGRGEEWPECPTYQPILTATPVEEEAVEVPPENLPREEPQPPVVAQGQPDAEEFDFDDPETFDDPDLPEYYENAKVKRSVILASVTRTPGDEPYPNVAVKLGSEPQVLPVAADVPGVLLASANYLTEATGDYTQDDGDTVPMGVTLVEDNPPIAIGFDEGDGDGDGDGDRSKLGRLTEEEFNELLDEAAGKPAKPGKPAAAAKEPIIIAPLGITVKRGPIDTKATGLDQFIKGGASGGGVVRSEPQRNEPKVPEGLKADAKTAGLSTSVAPEPARLTQPDFPGSVTNAEYKKYHADKNGLRIQTTVKVTHLPGDDRTTNSRDCRIIVRATKSKISWSSGDKSGEFMHDGGSRTLTHNFKAKDTVSKSFTLADLELSFKDLAEILKVGLPDGDRAGSAKFDLTIKRGYEIIISCLNRDGREVRYVIERGSYERKLAGVLVEKRNRDAFLGDSDRTGEFEFEDLGVPKPAEATSPRKAGDGKTVKRLVPPKKLERKKLALRRAAPSQSSFAIIQKEGEPRLDGAVAGLMCVSNRFKIGEKPVTIVKVADTQREQFISEASARRGVERVEIDPCRKKEVAGNDPYFTGSGLWGQDFEDQWAIRRVGLDDEDDSALALPGEDLAPMTVAVIDTGADWFHPELPAGRFWSNEAEFGGSEGVDDDGNGFVDDVIGWNFIDRNNLPWDQDGHGTFVAGVIAAESDNFVGIAGINPAARLMVLKALDAFGQGHASMAAQAIVYAADNGARVINLSLGGETPTAMEALAIDHARSRGAVVVVAAGNSGEPVEQYAPAGLPGVITVAASDHSDKRASFSNWGPMVDIAAPGVDVLSLRARQTDLLSLIRDVDYRRGNAITGDDGAYYRASGTSFAAPIVAGVASLMLSKRPELSGEQVARMILHSARDIETPGVDNFTGYGLLDAKAALRADPDFFVEARIEQVRGVQVKGTPALRITGTIDADRMAKANIFLGEGADPQEWRRVNIDLTEQRRSAPLLDLPASLFSGSPTWTIRLVTTHAGGMTRESRLTLNLQ